MQNDNKNKKNDNILLLLLALLLTSAETIQETVKDFYEILKNADLMDILPDEVASTMLWIALILAPIVIYKEVQKWRNDSDMTTKQKVISGIKIALSLCSALIASSKLFGFFTLLPELFTAAVPVIGLIFASLIILEKIIKNFKTAETTPKKIGYCFLGIIAAALAPLAVIGTLSTSAALAILISAFIFNTVRKLYGSMKDIKEVVTKSKGVTGVRKFLAEVAIVQASDLSARLAQNKEAPAAQQKAEAAPAEKEKKAAAEKEKKAAAAPAATVPAATVPAKQEQAEPVQAEKEPAAQEQVATVPAAPVPAAQQKAEEAPAEKEKKAAAAPVQAAPVQAAQDSNTHPAALLAAVKASDLEYNKETFHPAALGSSTSDPAALASSTSDQDGRHLSNTKDDSSHTR